jgi:hypothetical protein
MKHCLKSALNRLQIAKLDKSVDTFKSTHLQPKVANISRTIATDALYVLLFCLLTIGRPIGSGLPGGVEIYCSHVTPLGACGGGND